MSRHDRLTPDLQQAHAANRLAIARARQEAIFVIRGEKRAEIAALAKRMAAEARAEGRTIDWDAYTRESNRIEAEYFAKEQEAFPTPVRETGRFDRLPKPGLRGWGRI